MATHVGWYQQPAWLHLWSKVFWQVVAFVFIEGDGTPLQCSCLENPRDGGAWWAAVHGVTKSQTQLSNFTFTFHFHALEKEMASHASVLAWRIPGTEEPGGLPSMGSPRVRHDWSDLAAAAFVFKSVPVSLYSDSSSSIFPAQLGWVVWLLSVLSYISGDGGDHLIERLWELYRLMPMRCLEQCLVIIKCSHNKR